MVILQEADKAKYERKEKKRGNYAGEILMQSQGILIVGC